MGREDRMEGGHRECFRKGDSVGTTSGLAPGDVSSLREQDEIGSHTTTWGRKVERHHSPGSPTGDELSWEVVGRWGEAGGTTPLRGWCFLKFITAVRISEWAEYGQVLKLDLGTVQMQNGTRLKKYGL